MLGPATTVGRYVALPHILLFFRDEDALHAHPYGAPSPVRSLPPRAVPSMAPRLWRRYPLALGLRAFLDTPAELRSLVPELPQWVAEEVAQEEAHDEALMEKARRSKRKQGRKRRRQIFAVDEVLELMGSSATADDLLALDAQEEAAESADAQAAAAAAEGAAAEAQARRQTVARMPLSPPELLAQLGKCLNWRSLRALQQAHQACIDEATIGPQSLEAL